MKHSTTAAIALALTTPVEAQQRPSVAPKAMQAIAPALAGYTDAVLFGDVWLRPGLSPRDRSIVTLSVLIATGRTPQLSGHLGRGMTNGVTPIEIAGMVTHLAFYTGWPNAVSSLNEIEKVFAERGMDPAALPVPGAAGAPPSSGPARAAAALTDTPSIAPKFAELTKDVVFGDLWRRTDLAPRDRSLVTIAALAANGDDRQLAAHLRLARENGLTQAEIVEAFTPLAFYAGWPRASAAIELTAATFAGGEPASAPTTGVTASRRAPARPPALPPISPVR